MTTTEHLYQVGATTGIPTGTPATSGEWTWDDTFVPHLQGTYTIALDAVTDLAALDPRQRPAPRTSLVAQSSAGDVVGVTGVIRRRFVDRLAGTLRIEFAGRESVVRDWGSHNGTSAFWNQPTILDLLRAVYDDVTSETLNINGPSSTPVDDSDEAALIWAHRQGAWDFIDQVMAVHDLAFFDRGDSSFWYLREIGGTPDPAPGGYPMMPYSAVTQMTEEISRDGDWADFVHADFTASPAGTFVVNLPSGGSVEISDTFWGESETPKPDEVKEYATSLDSAEMSNATQDRVARRIRNKRLASGEVIVGQDVSQYDLRPWQAITIGQPDGSTIDRVISAITHNIDTQRMTITARAAIPAT